MTEPADLPAAVAAIAVRAHALPAEAVASALGTGPGGLSPAEAERRRVICGTNRATEAAPRSALAAFLAQFNSVLIYVLIAAAVTTALLGHLLDTSVIVGVVLINAVLGYIQERRAERSLEAIRNLISPRAAVIRDGRQIDVSAEDVVPGDLVAIEAGDRVPADIRLGRSRNLLVDEAVLTGESVPVDKANVPTGSEAVLAERTAMAYAGTTVARGQATGFVVATGDRTEIGRIGGLLRRVETRETPLTRQLADLARTLTWLILIVSVAVFVYGTLVWGMPADDLFLTVVGLAVAAIPEGLPAIVTIALSIGVGRMARRNAIIRHLPSVGTLGAVGVICSDKTGTFTRNEMVVQAAVTGDGEFAISGEGYRPEGSITRDGAPLEALPESIRHLGAGAAHCNAASLARGTGGDWIVSGDPMEGALLAFAAKTGVDPHSGLSPQIDAIPFDAEHRFMATLHAAGSGSAVIYVKGAPERVIAMCDRTFHDGTSSPIDRRWWEGEAERLAGSGMRVLAVAEVPQTRAVTTLALSDVEGGLILVGLLGLLDPPREEAIAAIARCRNAGITVKMITGDHAGTAAAIAARLGFARPSPTLVGSDLDVLDGPALTAAAEATDVFARTSPEHKLRLVEALQATGAIVAMTGDGVNDAPALKRADIGVAMGKRGADAAKGAAAIVLADDNFATIAAAVEEGRQVHDNLRKTIAFILPTNAGEAFVLIVAVLLGIVSPITPVQILWVNLITEVTLSIALAFEVAENDLMRRPPRKPGAPILSRFVLWRVGMVAVVIVAGVFAVFAWETAAGASLEYARTAAVNTIVAFEIAYLFSVRRLRGPGWVGLASAAARPFWIAVAVIVGAQVAFTYLPAANLVFGTTPLDSGTWLGVIAVSATIFVVSEGEKLIVGRWQSRPA